MTPSLTPSPSGEVVRGARGCMLLTYKNGVPHYGVPYPC